jgi:hypothetical protein
MPHKHRDLDLSFYDVEILCNYCWESAEMVDNFNFMYGHTITWSKNIIFANLIHAMKINLRK